MTQSNDRLDLIVDRLAQRTKRGILTQKSILGDLTVTIPYTMAEAAHLGDGIPIELEIINGNILIKPQAKTEYSLDELLAGVTPENCHGETDWGEAVGVEVW
jgi:antitoxin MazE